MPDDAGDEGSSGEQFAQILEEFRTLNGRMTSFRKSRSQPARKAGERREDRPRRAASKRWTSTWSALRNTETVNQRLFDSLHEELIKYRDNFLHESLQKPFIRDLVILFDDLSGLSSQLQTAAKRAAASEARWANGAIIWKTRSIR